MTNGNTVLNVFIVFLCLHSSLITHKVWRWLILLFYGGMAAVFIYFASKLKVQEEQVCLFSYYEIYCQFQLKR